MPVFREEEEEDSLYDDVVRMADRMGLKGEKRATYIDDHMTQGGYERVQSRESYAKIRQEEEEPRGGNRWGFGASPAPAKRRVRRDEEDDSY